MPPFLEVEKEAFYKKIRVLKDGTKLTQIGIRIRARLYLTLFKNYSLTNTYTEEPASSLLYTLSNFKYLSAIKNVSL